MSHFDASEILRTLRRLGKAKGDPFELLMVEKLKAQGVGEERARKAARICANKIWNNGLMTGAVTTVIVNAAYGNVPAAVAGGSLGAFVGVHTYLFSESCREVRSPSDFEVNAAVSQLLGEESE